MKIVPSRFLPAAAAVVVATAACLATATVVEAQTSPPPAGSEARPPMPPHPPGDRWGGGHEMRAMREAQRLKTSLQLNGQQASLWDRAIATMKPDGDMREQMKARHDRLAAMLDDPNFDPRRMAAEMDRIGDERKARTKSTREAWFAFYDSLNPVQRGQVREFLRERMARGMERMHGGMERMHGGMEWHHRDGAGPGMAPMPPQAPPSR